MNHDTPIEIVAKTSLGIDGCALHEFGLIDTSNALPGKLVGPEWDSEEELSDLEPMEGAIEWEAEQFNDHWKEVKVKKWGGRQVLSQS